MIWVLFLRNASWSIRSLFSVPFTLCCVTGSHQTLLPVLFTCPYYCQSCPRGNWQNFMSKLSEIGFMERDTTSTVAVGTLNHQMCQPKVQWPQRTCIAPPYRLHDSNHRNFFLPFIYLNVFTFFHWSLVICFKQDLTRVGNFVKTSISQILEILTQQICSGGNIGLSECAVCSLQARMWRKPALE